MSLNWRVVPIERWPTEPTKNRRESPFSVQKQHTSTWGDGSTHSYTSRARGVNWSETTDLLERELRFLGAKNILLQMQVTDRDIRNDGWIKATARPLEPGVILSFDSKHGPLSYPCDTFRDWQTNVRAIALALEALRKVDRYGVTRRGEQYTGFKGLPPAGGSTPTMTTYEAARILVGAEGLDGNPEDLLESADAVRLTFRAAAKNTHPDVGGSVESFQLVNQAKAILERHHTSGVAQ